MSSGAHHYVEAERLLAGKPPHIAATPLQLAQAQVHATLALAAATALNGGDGSGGLPEAEWTAWLAAAKGSTS
jgi:hypothetical protein